MTNFKNVAVIITAAGTSTRMGGSVKKEYMPKFFPEENKKDV